MCLRRSAQTHFPNPNKKSLRSLHTVHQIHHQVETLPTPIFFAFNQFNAIVNTIYVAKKI